MNWIPWPESIKKRACRYILQDWILNKLSIVHDRPWQSRDVRTEVKKKIIIRWKNYVGEFLHEKIRLEQLNVDLYQGTGSVSGKFLIFYKCKHPKKYI